MNASEIELGGHYAAGRDTTLRQRVVVVGPPVGASVPVRNCDADTGEPAGGAFDLRLDRIATTWAVEQRTREQRAALQAEARRHAAEQRKAAQERLEAVLPAFAGLVLPTRCVGVSGGSEDATVDLADHLRETFNARGLQSVTVSQEVFEAIGERVRAMEAQMFGGLLAP